MKYNETCGEGLDPDADADVGTDIGLAAFLHPVLCYWIYV